MSLHIEHANQALQQTVVGAPDAYSIGVVLNEDTYFRANGQNIGCEDIFIVPPGCTLHLRSPEDGMILAVIVSTKTFERAFSVAPAVADWLLSLRDIVACCRAPTFAQRLRNDAYNALKTNALDSRFGQNQTLLGEILVNSLVSSLILEWGNGVEFLGAKLPRSFSRFLAIQKHTSGATANTIDIAAMSEELSLSRRSIQYAYAQEGTLGFGAYQRLLRLHAARRSLSNPANTDKSIGDIAAEFGFLNWSHFGEQYLTAFGERPSDTRSRLN
ncbi:AraC family transcriptional regulator [Cognatiyoonia sediminum]|uniref:AraC family transcriptional regulator n=1 Tax=Cognatiyoonia sediminum TaxID=1508389 RepID=UPI0009334AF8|nr:AraC family transcriptional regulator [Cognatiyoonia sediminum]